MTNHTCTVFIEINATQSTVWDALINPEKVKQYLFGTNLSCDWKVGSPIKFTGEWEGKAYEDKGVVLQFQPEQILKYSYWSGFTGQADLPENYQTITFRLTEEKGKSLLTLTQENCKTEEARARSEQNWNMVLTQVKALLEK